MKLHYLTIEWDNYWKQVVIGRGVYLISKFHKGCIYWKRLFGIGKRIEIEQ